MPSSSGCWSPSPATRTRPFEPLIGLLIAAWVFYMAFEAYHTARKRRYGVAVEEFSSLFDVRPTHGRFPAGALLLIGLGFILLLDTTDIISMDQLERYWPVGLILFGLYMLYARLSPAGISRIGECGGAKMNDQSAYLVRAVNGPIILITIGVLFAFDRFTEFRFSQTWPVLLIVVGLLQGWRRRRRRVSGFPPQPPPPPSRRRITGHRGARP